MLRAGAVEAAACLFAMLHVPRGIRWIGPVRAGVLMLVQPLVGVALAALFLQEAVGPVQAAGGLGILAAAVIIQRASPAEPPAAGAARLNP